MDSDFPEFDKVYYRVLLPENPNQFDLLAANANFSIYHHDLWNGVGKRFAESIVNECIGVITNAVDHREPASTYADKIKEHFGMETVDNTLRNRSTYFGNNP